MFPIQNVAHTFVSSAFKQLLNNTICFCIILDSKADIGKENVMPKPRGRAPNPNNKFKCEFENCQRSYQSSKALRLHVKSVHEGVSYDCDQCDKSFAQKGDLKRHVEIVHMNMKNFKCDECDQSFGQKAHLESHISTVHRNEKNFKCDTCGKSFGLKQNLNKHIRNVHKM